MSKHAANDTLADLGASWIKKRDGVAAFPKPEEKRATPDPLSKPADPKPRINKVRNKRNTAAKRQSGELVGVTLWVEPAERTAFKIEATRRGLTLDGLFLEMWKQYQSKK